MDFSHTTGKIINDPDEVVAMLKEGHWRAKVSECKSSFAVLNLDHIIQNFRTKYGSIPRTTVYRT